MLTIKDGEFKMDGESFRIYSGSMHYFRIMPEYWEDRLRKLKAAGFNTVETYVCWNMHEPRKGEFDFTGRFDIRRFIPEFNQQNAAPALPFSIIASLSVLSILDKLL